MLMYVYLIKPMFGKLSEFFNILNEFSIYFCALFAFVLTDYTYIDVEKYNLAQFWIAAVITTVLLNFLNLFFTVGYRSKKLLENYLERRRRLMR